MNPKDLIFLFGKSTNFIILLCVSMPSILWADELEIFQILQQSIFFFSLKGICIWFQLSAFLKILISKQKKNENWKLENIFEFSKFYGYLSLKSLVVRWDFDANSWIGHTYFFYKQQQKTTFPINIFSV